MYKLLQIDFVKRTITVDEFPDISNDPTLRRLRDEAKAFLMANPPPDFEVVGDELIYAPKKGYENPVSFEGDNWSCDSPSDKS